MSKRIDIRGEIFGNLLVLRFIESRNSHAFWKCKCLICRKATFSTYSNLKSGGAKSCQSCAQRKLPAEIDIEISNLYTTYSYTTTELAEKYNVGISSIRYSLQRTGAKIRRKGKRPIEEIPSKTFQIKDF